MKRMLLICMLLVACGPDETPEPMMVKWFSDGPCTEVHFMDYNGIGELVYSHPTEPCDYRPCPPGYEECVP